MSPYRQSREITEDKILVYEKALEQLFSFYREIGHISKKKPSEPLNKFKLGFINQTLILANELLGDEFRPFPDFTTFDVEGSMPTASDVVMMLDQYREAMKRFKAAYSLGGSWNRPKPVAANEEQDDDGEYDDEDDDGEELDGEEDDDDGDENENDDSD